MNFKSLINKILGFPVRILFIGYFRGDKIKIVDELKGKDVIDDSGDKIGEVKDVEWDPLTNKVDSIILREGGVSAKVGLGEKRIVPFNMVKTIGDKVLLEGKHFMRE